MFKKFRMAFGKTFKLPFRRAYLTIKLDAGPWAFPPDGEARALKMMIGKLPADSDFLARAWFNEHLKRRELEQKHGIKVRLLERKISAQRMELKAKRQPNSGNGK